MRLAAVPFAHTPAQEARPSSNRRHCKCPHDENRELHNDAHKAHRARFDETSQAGNFTMNPSSRRSPELPCAPRCHLHDCASNRDGFCGRRDGRCQSSGHPPCLLVASCLPMATGDCASNPFPANCGRETAPSQAARTFRVITADNFVDWPRLACAITRVLIERRSVRRNPFNWPISCHSRSLAPKCERWCRNSCRRREARLFSTCVWVWGVILVQRPC